LYIADPFPGSNIERINCLSYPGRLGYGQDWERVFPNNQSKIWIKIEPKVDEIFEMFLYE